MAGGIVPSEVTSSSDHKIERLADALLEFVERVAKRGDATTAAELEALPVVASVLSALLID